MIRRIPLDLILECLEWIWRPHYIELCICYEHFHTNVYAQHTIKFIMDKKPGKLQIVDIVKDIALKNYNVSPLFHTYTTKILLHPKTLPSIKLKTLNALLDIKLYRSLITENESKRVT